MAIHWQIHFKSLRVGALATVNIYDADYTGDPIPLKGGAEPFVTQEDDDEDIFTPVRTQSGYIRIVDDGKDANGNAFNWKDLVPSTDVDRRSHWYQAISFSGMDSCKRRTSAAPYTATRKSGSSRCSARSPCSR